jgi:hypothetical protein
MNATHARSYSTAEVDYRLARADQVRERSARGFRIRPVKIPSVRTDPTRRQLTLVGRWLRRGTPELRPRQL